MSPKETGRTKLCSRCKEVKPSMAFRVDRRQKSGRRPDCRECQGLRERQWRITNREKLAAKRRAWRINNPEKAEKAAARSHAWRLNNPEKAAACHRQWRLNNREKLAANKRQHYLNNREKHAANMQKWYLSNREQVIARSLEWARNNPEKAAARLREWQRKNPEKCAAWQKAWRKTERGRMLTCLDAERRRRSFGDGDCSLEQWEAILRFYGHRCAQCGGEGKMTIDHFIPLGGRGIRGSHDWRNLWPLCERCNKRKGAKMPAESAPPHATVLLLEAN
jgi:5-methylcytosine-specific restriction endonuclease McrA